MPRRPRICLDGVPLHIVNRGNKRQKVFLEDADYLGFLSALATASARTTVRLLVFCLMPNHFHLVLWPTVGREVSAYMQIVMNAHIRDLQRRHGTSGTGHIYQGRYRSSTIFTERHLVTVCRYVEANGLAAGLSERAELWPWCSLTRSGPAEDVKILSDWPVPRPANWLDQVNRPVGDRVWTKIKKEIRNSQPDVRFLRTAIQVG
jgi:putative transposase